MDTEEGISLQFKMNGIPQIRSYGSNIWVSDLEGIKLDWDLILIAHSPLSFNMQLKCLLFSKPSLTSPGKVKYFLC